ncbi:alpha/beta hydrolase fold domain-containing protein [Methyloceanibacter sp.]|uniref:alpha/beta hydrolase fold domain-containing protein n=1 Tax=Methyloceanibacter sp. TaxID=1965321 RepID=UPI003C706615
MALAGDSAGGNFAAVTAIRARDAGMQIGAQVLIYGALEQIPLRHDRSLRRRRS